MKTYAAQGKTVYGTLRSPDTHEPSATTPGVKFLTGIDLTKSDVGDTIVRSLPPSSPLEAVVRT